MSKFNLFAQIQKVDEAKRTVYGRAVQEVVDRSGEVFDYASSKPHFQKWSNDIATDTGGKSLGNVRAMHGKVAAGKLSAIDFNDVAKAIDVAAVIVDDGEWKKVMEGVYTGFSIGGSYVGEKKVEKVGNTDVKRYTANPSEISLVDRPCIPTAKFYEIMRADGSTLQKAFREGGEVEGETEDCGDPEEEGIDEAEKKKRTEARDAKAASDKKADDDKPFKVAMGDGTDTGLTVRKADAVIGGEIEGAGDAMLKITAVGDGIVTVEKAVADKSFEVNGTDDEVAEMAATMNEHGMNMADVLKAIGGYARLKKLQAPKPPKRSEVTEEQTVAKAKDLCKADGHDPEGEDTSLTKIAQRQVKRFERYLEQAEQVLHKDAANEGGVPAIRKMLVCAPETTALVDALSQLCKSEGVKLLLANADEPDAQLLKASMFLAGDVLKGVISVAAAEAGEDGNAAYYLLAGDALGDVLKLHDDPLGAALMLAKVKAGTDEVAIAKVGDLAKALGALPTGDLSKLEGMVDALVAKKLEPVLLEKAEMAKRLKKLEDQPAPSKVTLRAVAKGDDIVDHDTTPAVVVKSAGGEINEAASEIKKLHQGGGQPLLG